MQNDHVYNGEPAVVRYEKSSHDARPTSFWGKYQYLLRTSKLLRPKPTVEITPIDPNDVQYATVGERMSEDYIEISEL